MNQNTQQESEEHLQPIATFILKAYAILMSPQNASIIGWQTQGHDFIIRDVPRFTNQLLPLHFRHHKYESFIRQLNMYSFSKIKSSEGPSFTNPYFKRGGEDLLRFIKRKPERKKRGKNEHSSELISLENKENEINMISQVNLPIKTKDQIEDDCQFDNSLIKTQNVGTVRSIRRKVTFQDDLPSEHGGQNFSSLMEPSCKWIANKEDSCWQNINSFTSIKPSMKLLSFDEEPQFLKREVPILLSKISGVSADSKSLEGSD